jgi:serine/threonine protein kinase
MEYKVDKTDRFVYQCHNEFGPLRNLRNIPQIVDFGMSTILDCEDDWGVYPIQPDDYRAPEVILGCGWRMSADIWNLGVLVQLKPSSFYRILLTSNTSSGIL